MDCCPNPKRSTAAVPRLPEDAVLEILTRLPARSVHRFKCVSQRWCDLIADPIHRKRLPQTLEGFFCSDAENYFYGEFISLPGITAPLLDPSFSFLPKLPGSKSIRLLHSCHGLLLFGGHGTGWGIDGKFGYIVCNPATEQWVAVPSAGIPSPKDCAPTYIIFDPAVSSHFHLFHFWQNDNQGVIEAHIYSSETRVWTDCTSEQMRWQEGGGWKQWLKGAATFMGNTFLNGMLHFIVFHRDMGRYLIAGVGWEGKTCRAISWPDNHGSSALFLGQCQGHLYCMSGYQEGEGFYQSGISIWVLQDYDTEEWVLKHNVSFLKLFGQSKCRIHVDYNVVAIHPDCNWVFLVHHRSRKLIAYDMDCKKVHALHTFRHSYGLCTPYIPYYQSCQCLLISTELLLSGLLLVTFSGDLITRHGESSNLGDWSPLEVADAFCL